MKTSMCKSRTGMSSSHQTITQRSSSTISLKDQLSMANLENARHMTLLSKIHHIAITNAGENLAFEAIKRLIDRSGLLNFDSSSSQDSEPSQASQPSQQSQQGRTLTPPVTDSEAHSVAHSDLTAASGDLTDCKRRVSNNGLSTTFQTFLTDTNILQNVADLDNNPYLSFNNNNTHKQQTAIKPPSSLKTNTPLLDIFEMSTEVHTTAAPAVIQPLAVPTMPTIKSNMEVNVKENEYEDEFTLEEELEGIDDAPVEKRAAMRKALREKQTAVNRQMREAAADKRRNAEKEAYLIKQTLLRDGHPINTNSSAYSQPQPQPQQPAVQATFVKSPAAAAAKTTVESVDTDIEPPRNAPFVPVGVDDSDDDSKTKFRPVNSKRPRPNYVSDASRSSIIIDFETEAPKNSSRFGISFDASKLDEATMDRISGIKGVKDSRRSVLVQNIGPETTVHEFLSYIRGGSVLDVKLTADPSDGGKTRTAMVTFKTSKGAHACLALSSTAGFQTGSARKWRFSLLPTASYPTNDVIQSCAPGYAGMSLAEVPTRCLAVENFPKSLVNELCTELYLNKLQVHNKVHVVEEMWFARDTLHIHFTSIQEAKKAHGIISVLHYGRYRAGVHYSPDPCTQVEAGLSSDSIAKTASDGYQGLKSLLETTGLVSYAKLYVNKMKSSVAASAPRSAPRSVTMSILSAAPAGAPVRQQGIRPIVPEKHHPAASLSSAHSTASLLMSLDAGMSSNNMAKPVAASESSPWTDTLMSGLDMF